MSATIFRLLSDELWLCHRLHVCHVWYVNWSCGHWCAALTAQVVWTLCRSIRIWVQSQWKVPPSETLNSLMDMYVYTHHHLSSGDSSDVQFTDCSRTFGVPELHGVNTELLNKTWEDKYSLWKFHDGFFLVTNSIHSVWEGLFAPLLCNMKYFN